MNVVRLLKRRLPWFIILTPLFLLLCTNPTDNPQWRTTIELPVTSDKQFSLGAMLDTMFFKQKGVQTREHYDTNSVTGEIDTTYDTTMAIINNYPRLDSKGRPIPDTVAFSFPTRDSVSDTITEDSLGAKFYGDAFGLIPLDGAPDNTVSIPLASLPHVAGTPIAASAVPLNVTYVYRIDLADTAQTLDVILTNNTSVTMNTVRLTLGTLGTSSVSNLAPGSSKTASFDAQNKRIDSVVNVTVSVTPASSGIFAAGSSLGASFSLDGLKAKRVVVNDYLLAGFERVFSNKYKLSDTVEMDYIDINDGYFTYIANNHTTLKLLLSVTHRHLWHTSFCVGQTPKLNSVNDLIGLVRSDTVAGYSGMIAVQTRFSPGERLEYKRVNISKDRLFPYWDEDLKQTVTQIDYLVRIDTSGSRVTLDAADTLGFIVRSEAFSFKEMYGRSKERFFRATDPSTVPVTLPWNQEVTSQLRNNFVLEKVFANLETQILIPEGAYLDTIRVHYEINSVTNPSVACTSDVTLLHVTRDSLFLRPVDITKVVNDYPDSVRVKISLTIPDETPIKIVNDLTDVNDPDYLKYMGRMIIKAKVDYNLTAPLSWHIADTAALDLGGDTLDLDAVGGIIDPFRKMTDRQGSFTAQITNNTNVYLKLYALMATGPAQVAALVDTGSEDYISPAALSNRIDNPRPGYVSLLDTGLLIPPRDSANQVTNTILLDKEQLSQILDAEVTAWRWQVRFLPKYSTNGSVNTTPDAMSSTDWIRLNSWIHIDGVNNVDALMDAF